MAVVYRHIRMDKGVVFYIGYSSDKQSDYRPYTYFGRNRIWERISEKTDIKVEIILDELSDRDALAWEKYLIGLYGKIALKTGTLANLTDGGEGSCGAIWSEESKQRMSEITKRRFANKENHPLYGKTGESHPCFGQKRSDKFRRNQSIDKTGEKNPMYGKKGGKCPNSVKITDGNTVWDSVTEAAKHFGHTHQYLSKMLLGQRANKFNLRYL